MARAKNAAVAEAVVKIAGWSALSEADRAMCLKMSKSEAVAVATRLIALSKRTAKGRISPESTVVTFKAPGDKWVRYQGKDGADVIGTATQPTIVVENAGFREPRSLTGSYLTQQFHNLPGCRNLSDLLTVAVAQGMLDKGALLAALKAATVDVKAVSDRHMPATAKAV